MRFRTSGRRTRLARALGRPAFAGAIALAVAGAVPGVASAASTLYVDDGWVGTVNGTDPDGAGPATSFGTDSFATIAAAVAAAGPGDQIRVFPGNYNESSPIASPPGCSGDTVGLYLPIGKPGLAIRGVDASNVAITNAAAVQATVTTVSNLCFGPDGIFVEGDNDTIAGLRIGANTGGQNKTIEVVGDNFSLLDCDIADTDGSVYLNDFAFDTVNNVSHVKAYAIQGNIFEDGVSIDIASGAGFSGPVAGRQITGNMFTNSESWPSISFNGSGSGVPWFLYSVGGAVITGNTFSNTNAAGQQIRARGTYDNTQFDWASYFNSNTFNRSVVFGSAPPATLGTFTAPSGFGTFTDIRRIGTSIQGELDHTSDGDTVLVGPGQYDESPNIAKSVTLKSSTGRATTTIALQTGPTYTGALTIDGTTVTVDGFTIKGRDAACPTLATTNIFVNTNPDTVTIKNNRLQVGKTDFSCSTGDDGFGFITTYSAPTTTVLSVDVENNDIVPLNTSGTRAFYVNPGLASFTFSNNQVTGKFDGLSITQADNSTITDNEIDGQGLGGTGLGTWGDPDASQYGHAIVQGNRFAGLTTGFAIIASNNVTMTCNTFTGNGKAVRVRDDFPAPNFNPATIDIHDNAFLGDTTAGVANDASTPGNVSAKNDWWGCVAGPGNAGCDAVTGAVTFTPFATSVPACVSCASDAECSDGVACNGTETCNPTTHVCQSGSPVNCSSFTNQCNTGVCNEPTGTCSASPLPDTTTCNNGADTCSVADHCVAGVCVNNGGGGDTDADGICNANDNCPTVANPDQADIDADGVGNVCDAEEGTLNPTRVRMKATLSGSDRSNITTKGDFVTLLPGEVFPGSGPITFSVSDSTPFTPTVRSHTFPPSECAIKPTTVKCRSTDKLIQVVFKTSAAQNKVWKFTSKETKAALGAGPFVGPATVKITYGPAIDRIGEVTDCATSFSGMICRQLR